jgi:hypothetical protein
MTLCEAPPLCIPTWDLAKHFRYRRTVLRQQMDVPSSMSQSDSLTFSIVLLLSNHNTYGQEGRP